MPTMKAVVLRETNDLAVLDVPEPKVGPGCDPSRVGKRVALLAFGTCGECFFCKRGAEQLCPNTQHLGHGAGWGESEYYYGGGAVAALAVQVAQTRGVSRVVVADICDKVLDVARRMGADCSVCR